MSLHAVTSWWRSWLQKGRASLLMWTTLVFARRLTQSACTASTTASTLSGAAPQAAPQTELECLQSFNILVKVTLAWPCSFISAM